MTLHDNPLLQSFDNQYEVPAFDRIKNEHFLPAIEELIREAEEGIARIVSGQENPTFDNTILPLEEGSEHLGVVCNILYNLNHAETCRELQEIAQQASPRITDFYSRMMMNEGLFAKIRSLYQGYFIPLAADNLKPLTPEQSTVLENFYRDFVRNGALLNEDSKKIFAAIRSKLGVLELEFSDHVLAETNDFILHLTDESDLSGLPDFVRDSAAEEAKERKLVGWVFTLHATGYVPFMKYSDRRDLREKLHRAFSFRANRGNEHDNKDRMKEILALRTELAKLLGETDFATHQLRTKMAETPERVMTFLEQLHAAARPAALREFHEVQSYARRRDPELEMQSWDWAYYSEKLKEEKFGFTEEMLKPYFELNRVISGIFLVANELYGLTFKLVNTVPVYHPDVRVFEVIDGNGSLLSLFYADFFPRQGKQGGAWMTEFRGESRLGGKRLLPQISIVCNFTKPTASRPSLLTFDEVNTFLHEFGHALHGMLSQCTYPSVAGTNVYHDFVELPSQIMENWVTEKEWLDRFAVHYETGEKIPKELLDKIIASRNFLEGYATERQLGFGFCDMAWHTLTAPFNGDVIAFEQEATEKIRLFPRIEGSAFCPAFTHIFSGGYAAGYYGYKWAEVLDADAFELFKEKGIFNRDVARSFRENILEKGGSEHPMILYKRFRGKEPGVDALLRRSGLISD
ncbi:MAG: M3 family metallopeptidase [Bacteroidota bacterium]